MRGPDRSDALVLFGATGDLAKRKLFPALYAMAANGKLDVDGDRCRPQRMARRRVPGPCTHEAMASSVEQPDEAVLAAVCERLHLVGGDYSTLATFDALVATLDGLGATLPVHYLAIPPALFPTVIESLAVVGLAGTSRIVVEKPFGRDLASAQDLNRVLHTHLPEERVFRIDHYLGKEAVEDLLVFRFANTLLEPIWNRNYVASVQITMAETIGVEGRGAFYDSVGCLRDVVQNHLLQVVALLAMEPPVGPDARYLNDEKLKVFSAMRSLDASSMVRGQYDGYLAEPGVAPASDVETFAALRLEIESWRWAGVPFYVRAGKALGAQATEAVVVLKHPPAMLFDEAGPPGPKPNLIRFRLGSADGVTLTVNAKEPGPHLDSEPVDLAVDFASALGHRAGPYERLLNDALDGNAKRFGRYDMVEETWRIVQPALDEPGPLHAYARGSWGPDAATALAGVDGWYDPSVGPGVTS